jgi:hypothetical protein
MKKFLAGPLTALFVFGLLVGVPDLAAQVDALAKPRPVKRKVVKKTVRRKIKRPVKKYRKAKLAKPVKPAKKAPLIAKEPDYQLPSRAGMVVKDFVLNEAVDSSAADLIVSELKSIGVDEASFDPDDQMLRAKFNAQELSAVSLIKKLKDLGYTVKRID